MAWEVLNLIARYRIAQIVLHVMYTYALIPVSAAYHRSSRY